MICFANVKQDLRTNDTFCKSLGFFLCFIKNLAAIKSWAKRIEKEWRFLKKGLAGLFY